MSNQKTKATGRILPAPENHLTAEAVAAVRQGRRGFMRAAAGAAVAGGS